MTVWLVAAVVVGAIYWIARNEPQPRRSRARRPEGEGDASGGSSGGAGDGSDCGGDGGGGCD